MKILVSAYACEPGMGSEPGVGWNWVKEVSCYHEIFVITRTSNRENIEDALKEYPLPNVHFVYYDMPYWLHFWKKGNRGIHLYYYLWQLGIYNIAKQLNKEVEFDLIHHVTFGVYWKPSFLSLLQVPFIWGPVGGGESAPRTFWKVFSFRGRVYEQLRELARKLSEIDPFVKLTAKRSIYSLAKTLETKKKLERLGSVKVDILSEVTLPLEDLELLGKIAIRNESPFRVVSFGRLIHWKGPVLTLKAFALLNRRIPDCELWFVGDGPEKKFLEELTRQLGIIDKVTFWGVLSRKEALQKLGECDILVFPSLHDSGGWVCPEAMAAGRPVICLDLGGPATQVTEETGFKISAISPDQTVRDIAEAMYRLAIEPAFKKRLAEAGRKRVREVFTWKIKGEIMNNLYCKLVRSL